MESIPYPKFFNFFNTYKDIKMDFYYFKIILFASFTSFINSFVYLLMRLTIVIY